MIKDIEKRKAYKKQWYQENKDRLKEENKDSKKAYMKEYNEINKDKIKEQRKQYREQNKEKISQYAVDYEIRNRKQRNNYHNKYIKQNPIIKLRANIGSLVSRAMKGKKNGKSVFEFLPYTFEQLKEHIEKQFESWMSWENYGGKTRNPKKTWWIDHIIPQSSFIFENMTDKAFQECWALSNLRPLEKIANIKKGNKWN